MSTLVVYGGDWIGDPEALALAKSPYARGLRVIVLPCGTIGEVGFRALAESPHLRDVVYIELTGNPCDSLCQQVMDGYFLVGEAGRPSLRAAYSAAVVSYDPGGITWPPPWTDFAFTE